MPIYKLRTTLADGSIKLGTMYAETYDEALANARGWGKLPHVGAPESGAVEVWSEEDAAAAPAASPAIVPMADPPAPPDE